MTRGARPAPDFRGFAAALREEAEWSATIHPDDSKPRGGTGQAATDQAALEHLARRVEHVGEQLGLLEDGPLPGDADRAASRLAAEILRKIAKSELIETIRTSYEVAAERLEQAGRPVDPITGLPLPG